MLTLKKDFPIKLFELMESNSDKRLILIRSPPGSGKTVDAIRYAVENAREKRIGIFFRTRKEIEYAMRIYWQIVAKYSNPPLTIPIVGKDKLCRFPPSDPELSRWWCAFIECEYAGRSNSRRFLELYQKYKPVELAHLVRISFESGGCPFENVFSSLNEVNIILATHAFFVRDSLFEKLGKLDEVIIDEAHALMLIKTAEVDKKRYSQEHNITNRNLNRMAVLAFRSGSQEDARALIQIQNFLDAPGEIIHAGNKLIKTILPSELFKKRLKDARRIILLSATLYPADYFRRVFMGDINDSIMIVEKGMFESNKRKVLGLSIGLSTSFSSRNEKTLRHYAEIIKIVANKWKPILVFTTSYSIAEKIAFILGVKVSKDRIEDETIIITSMRSKLSEGIEVDVKGIEPKIALIIGLPFPKLASESKKILAYYAKKLNINTSAIVRAYMQGEMLIALVQAIGRIGRRKRGIAVIIDDRIMELGLNLSRFNSLRSLLSFIEKFLQSQ